MKTLYIARHAEAESGYKDFERALSPNGYKQAMNVGKQLLERNVRIQQIWASPAVRTLTTAQIFAEQIRFDSDLIQTKEELYNASLRIWLKLIQSFSDNNKEILIVGHNPHISYLVEFLTGDVFEGLGTSHVAVVYSSKSWKEWNEKAVSLESIIKPIDENFEKISI
ncbi:SixA phosphatase family protein [Raineya orbicola]|jgi:phosphohistidine phosphatase|uniref:Phosphohistidine phosphatase SixA n=1 Tax=Raineya orbicola TaxID=2016530 RepID=A0A2N3II50_9BACT|nr:histidine phosphatase family protein [Raineya orbicola]PKQ69966.1 Phosphohistidine phosphatase SixA [Raineya orbicola]